MNNQETPSDLQSRIESVDLIAEEPMPVGWSRRNWVQREFIAFGVLAPEPIADSTGKNSA